MGHWLVKTEPEAYSVDQFESERDVEWDGVRNPLAQQHLRQMEMGDPVLVYHSGKDRAIVGLAEVAKEAYLDPTDENSRAVCVGLKFIQKVPKSVSLAEIKAEPRLKQMPLVKMSRLSVMPISGTHWKILAGMLGITL